MGLNTDPVRAILHIAVCVYLFYNIAISYFRLGVRQLGVTEKYENAEALLFPSVTMCPMVFVNNDTLNEAVLNSIYNTICLCCYSAPARHGMGAHKKNTIRNASNYSVKWVILTEKLFCIKIGWADI